MIFKDYYKIMEVASNASPEEIKQAYKKLAHKFHPDISHEPNAEQRFKEINEAYEVLKDPQKRATYDSRFKLILPYTYAWFVAKKDAWMRTNAQMRAKKDAGIRAKKLLDRTKKNTGVYINKDNNVKSTQKSPLILMGFFVFILSAIIIAVIFAVERFSQWQNHQQTITALLQSDNDNDKAKEAIETLERSDVETQQQILKGEQVKNAVVRFYLQQANRPILTQLETYDDTIETHILKDDDVYRTLKAHFYDKITQEIDADNFNNALLLLDALKQKYPSDKELSDKHEAIKNLKPQRLAELAQQYTACLNQALVPLLEKTQCMAEAQQQIKHIDIEHTLPNVPKLPAMYVEEIKRALIENNYNHVDKLLLDWQNLLPAPSKQRDTLRENLAIHRQKNSIIADLMGSDKNKIIKRLNQLTTAQALQKELLEKPQIQNHLLDYHLKEALTLITIKEGSVNISSLTNRLEQLRVAAAREVSTQTEPVQSTPLQTDLESISQPSPEQTSEVTNPLPPTAGTTETKPSPEQTSEVTNPQPPAETTETSEVTNLLQECQAHFEAKRLTTGKEGTALNCYRSVLKREPNNPEALEGLKAIKNSYRDWVEYALQQNQLDNAKIYIVGLKKVARNSPVFAQLKQRLKEAIAAQKLETLQPQPAYIAYPSSQGPDICEGCNCSDLLKQLSMGIKPLTPVQREFLQTQCD